MSNVPLTLATPIESDNPVHQSQVYQALLNPPQRSGWPSRTPYTDDEVAYIITRFIHWLDTFGFNELIVFAQVLHETNYLRYTGDVQFGQHNFAGLGATGGVPGHSFPLPPEYNPLIPDDGIDAGALATVAHHAVYHWGAKQFWPAHLQQYAGEHVDPRYLEVLATPNDGKMHVLGDYRGTWAVPGLTYPESLIRVGNAILAFPVLEEPPMAAQIPGFAWFPADSDHYRPVRRAKVSGGAQHYSAGSNSLGWLTSTSEPPVSAHFLVKHEPTLQDRGWQLVRLEDEAWTTAYANPYTVAIEYEHRAGQVIPTAAYTVLAQTWADVHAYLVQQNLGTLLEKGIQGHKEWVGNPALICPNGIDVARIDAMFRRLVGQPDVDPDGDITNPAYDPVTKKWIPDEFFGVYQKYGGIWAFGRPITGAFMEMHEGINRLTQYFEGSILRHFPENQGDWQVQRDLLGTAELQRVWPHGAPA